MRLSTVTPISCNSFLTAWYLLMEVALMQRLDYCSREVAGYASWIQLIAAMVIAYHSASSHHGMPWFLGVGELNPSLHTHRGQEYVLICHYYLQVADLKSQIMLVTLHASIIFHFELSIVSKLLFPTLMDFKMLYCYNTPESGTYKLRQQRDTRLDIMAYNLCPLC